MQWNIAEAYNIAYQGNDLGSVAIAETMNQVCWTCIVSQSWKLAVYKVMLGSQNIAFCACCLNSHAW